ncbi:MAG TPA: hypothetical protein ENH33_00565 [Actinobacteria bacterium]|nr:hypothetical protein [Actinomycetota bacterium]
MTIIRETTIPSEFIRMDTRVTAADQFTNVRDQQIARENYNILLARRNRRPLLTTVFRNVSDYTITGQSLSGYGTLDPGVFQPRTKMLGPWRIRIPTFCKYVTIRIRAAIDTASGDVEIFPAMRGLNTAASAQATVPSSDYSATVTGTALAEYEIDCPVPGGGKFSRWMDLFLVYVCDSYGAGQGDPITVTLNASPGDRTVTGSAPIDAGTGGVGDLLYFISPSHTITAQIITAISGNTVTVENPFNVLPIVGDIYNSVAVARFIPSTMTVVPKAIADFGEGYGVT